MADNSKRDNLIEDYRTVVTNTILSNEIIVDLLSEGRLTVEEPDELLWTHLVPQQYVPETITETGSYILYDIPAWVNASHSGKNQSDNTQIINLHTHPASSRGLAGCIFIRSHPYLLLSF